MTGEPTCSCVHCGCPMFLFPSGTGWDAVKASYALCGLDVPSPTCGECVVERVHAGEIKFDRDLMESRR